MTDRRPHSSSAARDPDPWYGGRWRREGDPLALQWTADGWHLRLVQPYQARKVYRCPGCDHEIPPGSLHAVVWPEGEAEQRRHWHRACWDRRFAQLVREADRRR
jgi:hypothetical protein